jgi:hypothetical protein
LKNSLLLFGSLLIYLTGTFSVFTSCFQSYHKTVFQQQVQAQDEEESEKIFFTIHDFQSLSWIEKDKEFEWKGEMYDVNRIEQVRDGFWVYCENDGLEEILISFLKSVKKDMEVGTTNFNPQPQFFQSVLVFTFGSHQVKLERSSTEIPVFYKSICMSVLAPPPNNFPI